MDADTDGLLDLDLTEVDNEGYVDTMKAKMM